MQPHASPAPATRPAQSSGSPAVAPRSAALTSPVSAANLSSRGTSCSHSQDVVAEGPASRVRAAAGCNQPASGQPPAIHRPAGAASVSPSTIAAATTAAATIAPATIAAATTAAPPTTAAAVAAAAIASTSVAAAALPATTPASASVAPSEHPAAASSPFQSRRSSQAQSPRAPREAQEPQEPQEPSGPQSPQSPPIATTGQPVGSSRRQAAPPTTLALRSPAPGAGRSLVLMDEGDGDEDTQAGEP